MAKLQQGVNDLYTWCLNNGEYGQKILREWTGLDENNQTVSIDNVSYGSKRKIKWRCFKGHEWFTKIASRTCSNTGCPYCYKQGLKGRPQGRISLFQWCLTHGDFGQQLINEWTLSRSEMDSISYGSEAEAVWRCRKGHTWKTPITYRTSSRTGCPYCSGMLVSSKNALKIWCLNNGAWGKQLIKEWTGLDENNQPISIDSVARASDRKVKWRCSKGHEWYATIASRTSNNNGCTKCAKEQHSEIIRTSALKKGENDLYTWCKNNKEFGQQLINEWTGFDENNQQVSMDSFAYASGRKVKWRCSKGHEWFTTVSQRTIAKSGCPYCSGRLPNSGNNLKTWCLNNGSFGQQIISQWTGLDENNQPVSIDSVARASHKKVKWKCSKGHEWYTTINRRTSMKTGCPYCAGRKK